MAVGNQLEVTVHGDEVEVTLVTRRRSGKKTHGTVRVKRNEPEKLAEEIAKMRGTGNKVPLPRGL